MIVDLGMSLCNLTYYLLDIYGYRILCKLPNALFTQVRHISCNFCMLYNIYMFIYIFTYINTYIYIYLLWGLCMGSSFRCIVACAHLGNGTSHRTVRLMAPLLVGWGIELCFTVVGQLFVPQKFVPQLWDKPSERGTDLWQCALMTTS